MGLEPYGFCRNDWIDWGCETYIYTLFWVKKVFEMYVRERRKQPNPTLIKDSGKIGQTGLEYLWTNLSLFSELIWISKAPFLCFVFVLKGRIFKPTLYYAHSSNWLQWKLCVSGSLLLMHLQLLVSAGYKSENSSLL